MEEYDARGVSSAEAAVELLRDGPFEVMVTDVTLPGMSGLDLLRHCRRMRLIGAIIIGLGVFTSFYRFARALVPPQFERYNEIRLSLARYLALALEFQLGADILSTAIAPS